VRHAAFAGLLAIAFGSIPPSDAGPRALTFEDRVAAQKAIEQVYWNHRIWPKENPGPKPPLTDGMNDGALRAKVDDYLRKSNALETWWQRPIAGKQLQAEMDRMAKDSRDPKVLRELFAALGNDAFVIAETLARQTLADRLIRNWYANDTRFHADAQGKAEAARASCASVDCMKSMGGEYQEATLKLGEDELDRLSAKLATTAETLPLRQLSRVEDAGESFSVSAVLSRRRDETTIAVVVWPKQPFDVWWAANRDKQSSGTSTETAAFTLPAMTSTECTNDTWAPTSLDNVAAPRDVHTAVWTGAEMIVWGGYGGFGNPAYLASGGRYNPSTDTWLATSLGPNTPSARAHHSAVWTGTEMIVWGGHNAGQFHNTGGRYNPLTDGWTATSTGANAPSARWDHTAVWTGTEMIVWGGTIFGDNQNDGGRYSPSNDSWVATSVGANVPTGRSYHTAVWTGTEMIVWGGNTATTSYAKTGGRYNPALNNWTATSIGPNVPDGRNYHTAVWTGTEMIVWGGNIAASTFANTGGRYNPSTDGWLATSIGASVPTARYTHTAIWTGTQMIVWGGTEGDNFLGTGGRYSTSTGGWTTTSTGTNAPAPRDLHAAVWTGTRMIVWGGAPLTTAGGSYCACLNAQTVYRDADGDGSGDPAVTTGTNCDGSIPAGYAADGTDCDDTNAAIHPHAPEINDGIDNQCLGDAGYGVTDEISGVSGFSTLGDKTRFSWDAQGSATSYDVVRSTTRDFSSGCMIFPSSQAFVIDADLPPDEGGFYYLVRPSAPYVGSWGQNSDGTPRAVSCL
jgi:hypothetical protein